MYNQYINKNMRVFAYITIPAKGLPTALYVPLSDDIESDITILKKQTTDGKYDPNRRIYDGTRVTSHVIQLSRDAPSVSQKARQIIKVWTDRSDDLLFLNAIELQPCGSEKDWGDSALVSNFIFRSCIRSTPIEIIDYIIIQNR
jgi:hypothetical protein